MNVRFEEMFPWEVSAAIAATPLCYVPLGVLEWHGEHAAVGLDAIKAHALCVRAAQRSGGLVVPPLYWGTDYREDLPNGSYLTGGIEKGERYHVPGSMFWIRPTTFRALLMDMFEAMRRRGFQAIVALAGHWSGREYLPALHATVARFGRRHSEVGLLAITDQELGKDVDYLHEHAAGGEISILMALRPDLVALDKTFETDRSLRQHYAGEPEHLRQRSETPHPYIGVLMGTDDGSNRPEQASAERGWMLIDAISARLADRAMDLLAETGR